MWYFYILSGILSGIVGGMGMGGGTLLIPLLTIFLGVSQHTAQGINLIVFIPMGVCAIIIHIINKLIDFKTFFLLIVPAILTSVLAANLSSGLEESQLKTYFGCFLLIVAFFMFLNAIKSSKTKQKPILKNRIYKH